MEKDGLTDIAFKSKEYFALIVYDVSDELNCIIQIQIQSRFICFCYRLKGFRFDIKR